MNNINKYLEKVYRESRESFYEIVENNLKNNKKTFIITANPEIIMKSEQDEEIKTMLDDERLTIIPDGIAVVKGANKAGYYVKERITGIDVAEKLLEYSDKYKKKVYLFGAKQEVIDALTNVIKTKYSGINLIGTSNGYEKDKDAIMDKISSLKPDVLLVALGVPAQEKLIYKHYDKFDKGIFVGVGGSFDVLSGLKKRAPKFFINTNTEWLYRIAKEPSRLKRFYDSNIKFIFKVKRPKNKKEITK